MNRVCVLVGEGKSEKSFLSSLILQQLNFIEVQPKNCIVYQSINDKELFWIFPVPSYGITHKGGSKILKVPETYVKCHQIVRNYEWLFGINYEIHYRILTDTDNCGKIIIDNKNVSIKESFDKSKARHNSMLINYAHTEIESWFIAGLNETFPYLLDNKTIKIHLLNSDPDKLINPKEKLDSILSPTIRGDRERIARDFGEFIDINKAKTLSPSFNNFFTKMFEDNLLV